MSLTLTFAYHIRGELKQQPIEKRSRGLEYIKNYHGNDYYGYQYDISQGPLVELLTREIDCLEKAITPELFSKMIIIGNEDPEDEIEITHDPHTMLAIAMELKTKLETKGNDFFKEIGFRELSGNTENVLLEDLDTFIIFCEFGIANGIRFNHEFY